MRYVYLFPLILLGVNFQLAALPAQADDIYENQYRMYVAIESGWQSAEYKKIRYRDTRLEAGRVVATDSMGVFTIEGPKGNNIFTVTGGIGFEQKSSLFKFLIFSSQARSHIGGEVNVGYSSFRGSAPDNVYRSFSLGQAIPGQETTDTVRIKESLMLNVAMDVGLYMFESLLLFSRFGYSYLEAEREILSVLRNQADLPGGGTGATLNTQYAKTDAENQAFIIGVGLRYQLSAHSGMRFYYLNHIGTREAHDLRLGLLWWIF